MSSEMRKADTRSDARPSAGRDVLLVIVAFALLFLTAISSPMSPLLSEEFAADSPPYSPTGTPVGGNITGNVTWNATGIMIENANLIIINNTITWFDSGFQKGMNLRWTNGTIVNNSIENNTVGIFTCYYGPAIRGNNIANNVDWGVQNGDTTPIIDAELNWWNDDGGPDDDSVIGDYNDNNAGDDVSDYVDYRDWLTVPAF